jgi:hypothetical protein
MALTPSEEVMVGAGIRSADNTKFVSPFVRYSLSGAPVIAIQPVAASAHPGETLIFSATPAIGVPISGAQWFRNGIPLTDGIGGASLGGGVVFGANAALPSPAEGTSAVLTITNACRSDSGSYSVTFANTCGTAVSQTVSVAVAAICDGDLTGDAFVDDSDFVVFADAYSILICGGASMSPGCPSDINGDGFVDDSDFVLFAVAYELLLCP